MRKAFPFHYLRLQKECVMVNKVELLAPAGNMECLKAAVSAGADAVYLAGSQFGARAYADNFTTQELCDALDYCHLFGVKVYLTLNTLIKEREFSVIGSYVQPFYEHGLDGVIIQDFGALRYLHDHFPGMELHASTQMTVTGPHSTKLLQDYGVTRVVPARELSLAELREIKKETGIDMEVFVHGAMCYGYSGQCLFSSVLGGRSGNRGRCAGPCRLPYDVYHKDKRLLGKKGENYPLSLKDLCTVELIGELICAGMDSFKIEGRMKSAVYVAGVTAIYRKYIDRFYRDVDSYGSMELAKQHFKVEAGDLKLLKNLYVRTDLEQGYFHSHNGAHLVTIDKPSYQTGGEEINGMIAQKYLNQSPKVHVTIGGSFFAGKPQMLSFTCGDQTVCVTGDMVAKAQNRPMSASDIQKQVTKLGATEFVCDSVTIETDGQGFISNKQLNELRRDAAESLKQRLLAKYMRQMPACPLVLEESTVHDTPFAQSEKVTASVKTIQQLMALQENSVVSRIFLDMDLCDAYQHDTLFLELIDAFKDKETELALLLPRVIRSNSHKTILEMIAFAKAHGFDSVVTGSLEGLSIALEEGCKVIADAGLYCFNQEAVRWLVAMGVSEVTLPIECNIYEQKECITGQIPVSQIAYGYIPLMETAGCVAKTMKDCTKDSSTRCLKDRMGKEFTVQLHCNRCENTIYNCVPMCMEPLFREQNRHTNLRMDFTIETKQQTAERLMCFEKWMKGEDCDNPIREFTKGYYKRGVE